MSKKKACKKCKIFIDSDKCPICKGNEFTTNWQGRLSVLNAKKSMIGQKIKIDSEGEYAIKVR